MSWNFKMLKQVFFAMFLVGCGLGGGSKSQKLSSNNAGYVSGSDATSASQGEIEGITAEENKENLAQAYKELDPQTWEDVLKMRTIRDGDGDLKVYYNDSFALLFDLYIILEERVEAIEEELVAIDKRITDLEADLNTKINENIASLETRLKEHINAELNILKGRIEANEGSITTLLSSVETLTTRMDTAETDIKDIKKQIENNWSEIQESLTAMDITADDMSSALNGVFERIAVLDRVNITSPENIDAALAEYRTWANSLESPSLYEEINQHLYLDPSCAPTPENPEIKDFCIRLDELDVINADLQKDPKNGGYTQGQLSELVFKLTQATTYIQYISQKQFHDISNAIDAITDSEMLRWVRIKNPDIGSEDGIKKARKDFKDELAKVENPVLSFRQRLSAVMESITAYSQKMIDDVKEELAIMDLQIQSNKDAVEEVWDAMTLTAADHEYKIVEALYDLSTFGGFDERSEAVRLGVTFSEYHRRLQSLELLDKRTTGYLTTLGITRDSADIEAIDMLGKVNETTSAVDYSRADAWQVRDSSKNLMAKVAKQWTPLPVPGEEVKASISMRMDAISKEISKRWVKAYDSICAENATNSDCNAAALSRVNDILGLAGDSALTAEKCGYNTDLDFPAIANAVEFDEYLKRAAFVDITSKIIDLAKTQKTNASGAVVLATLNSYFKKNTMDIESRIKEALDLGIMEKYKDYSHEALVTANEEVDEYQQGVWECHDKLLQWSDLFMTENNVRGKKGFGDDAYDTDTFPAGSVDSQFDFIVGLQAEQNAEGQVVLVSLVYQVLNAILEANNFNSQNNQIGPWQELVSNLEAKGYFNLEEREQIRDIEVAAFSKPVQQLADFILEYAELLHKTKLAHNGIITQLKSLDSFRNQLDTTTSPNLPSVQKTFDFKREALAAAMMKAVNTPMTVINTLAEATAANLEATAAMYGKSDVYDQDMYERIKKHMQTLSASQIETANRVKEVIPIERPPAVDGIRKVFSMDVMEEYIQRYGNIGHGKWADIALCPTATDASGNEVDFANADWNIFANIDSAQMSTKQCGINFRTAGSPADASSFLNGSSFLVRGSADIYLIIHGCYHGLHGAYNSDVEADSPEATRKNEIDAKRLELADILAKRMSGKDGNNREIAPNGIDQKVYDLLINRMGPLTREQKSDVCGGKNATWAETLAKRFGPTTTDAQKDKIYNYLKSSFSDTVGHQSYNQGIISGSLQVHGCSDNSKGCTSSIWLGLNQIARDDATHTPFVAGQNEAPGGDLQNTLVSYETVIVVPIQFEEDAGQTEWLFSNDRSSVHAEITIHMYSPLVLDFSNGMPKSMSSNDGVQFDIDADGVKESTGWIQGDEAGFLALDLNKNGRIDDGSELFGEATAIKNHTGKQNGYLALEQYDDNQDGLIDVKDGIFNKLLVWFDQNSDGVSQKEELKSLNQAQVTGINVKYQTLGKGYTFDKGNHYKYQSSFYGPQCPLQGCKSYDIYFHTQEFRSARK